MAKKDFANQLAAKPPAIKAAILGGVAAFCGIFYYQFFYSGLSEEKE